MRILLVTYWSYPHSGGLSTYISELYKGLESHGHEVEVLAHTTDLLNYYLIKSGRVLEKAVITRQIAEQVLPLNMDNSESNSDWIRSQVIDRYSFESACTYFGLEDYDLIHAQDIVSSRAISLVKPPHIPLVTSIHGCYTLEFQRAGILNSLEELHYSSHQEYLGAESSDVVIVPSNWLMSLLHEQFGVSSDRMTLIPYGVDINGFLTKLKNPVHIQEENGSFIFMCPARLTAVKGHKFLLEALAILNKETTEWQCWFVGDGELRQELEQQCNQLGLEKQVLFLGNRVDVPGLLKKANVMVLPSIQDNLPFVIIEAQLAKKAIVTTDAGGIPEMIEHEKTGLIVPFGNCTLLYQEMKRLLEDSALRQQLGEQAGIRAMNVWSNDLMILRTLTIYEKAILEKKEG